MKKQIQTNFRGIIDSTLREGMQFINARFTPNQQLHIASLLAQIGVDYIEVSNPVNPELRRTIHDIVAHISGSSSRVLAHIRNRREDMEAASGAHVHGVNILCTVDAERLRAMGKSRTQYLTLLQDNIRTARAAGMEVRVSVEDYFNRSSVSTTEIFRLCEALQIDRIGIADTLGNAMNWDVFNAVGRLRDSLSTDIEVHFHNDLGNAVNNAVTSVAAGANYIDTTLLGIGERTGIPSLSQIMSNLYVIDPSLTSRYHIEYITNAENYIAGICGIEVPFNVITNTSNAFAHKAGIHLHALIAHGPQKYELFPPSVIGNRRRLIHDSTVSGRTNEQDVMTFYKLHGI